MNIKVKEITITRNDGILIIVFLDEWEQKYFMIQDVLTMYNEQDIKLGMNTYYIEINDQILSTYGGILGIKMDTQGVVFMLDATGRRGLKKHEITIDFVVSKEKYIELKEALSQLSNKHAISANF